jgi:hypothetical protein
MTKEIKIDGELVKAAEAALAQYPRTAAEQIEKWLWIGKAVSLELSERDLIELQLGNGTLTFKLKDND